MTSKLQAAGWTLRQRKWAGALALLVLAVGYLQARALPLPWHGKALAPVFARSAPPTGAAPAAPQGAAPASADLPRYQATIQHKAVAGVQDNLSGLTYSPRTGTLFGVTNSPPAVVELSTRGDVLRHLPIIGAKDTEGIAHIDGDWFAIADERRNRIHWVQIAPGQREISLQDSTFMALGDPAIKNFAVEGLGWDRQRQQLLAVTEKWPLQVLAIAGPSLRPGAREVRAAWQIWRSADESGLPTTDLASVEVDPRTGNLLLLGEESSVLYEYTRAGEPVGMMPLWAGMSGLEDTIGQPEGVAMDGAGTLYIVAEPNLFYRFEKRS